MQMYDGHSNYVRSLAFVGKYLCSASEDHTVRVYDLDSKEHHGTLHGHTSGVWASESVFGKLWTGGDDTLIKVWDPHTLRVWA